MTTFDPTSIPHITLSRGAHATPQEGVCFYEAVAFFAGEPHTDRPECACPVLTAYGIGLNDAMPHDLRNKLLIPLIGQVAGTRDKSSEQKRTEFLAMWAVNKIVPIALRENGLTEQAEHCEKAKTLPAANAATDAARAAYAAADAEKVWAVAVEGLRQAVLIGRHDGFATDPADKVDEFVKVMQNA